ncbi:GAF domain-containing protein [Mangrovimicrobium sediminis]|uniref:GAF domain-containing protein n=1 Tax=Mangrovimicrobium sediminis TaxID=2562682 RepID=A0A4Z0M6M5_9GAMM|nr:GAF domain-containing protein [Haliea sp. SAOS-164]TGD75060.1 GAF domain-containing protein [Haliea sp. SAOS-164]
MHPFVRVVEIWVPDASGEHLKWHAGTYGPLAEFADHSRDITFAPGIGLPGQAWREARPIIMKDLSDGAFLRADAAQSAGLTSGVAMPIFQGRDLRAVLVFLCGDHGRGDGAIEVWKDDGLSGQSLVDGYYGKLARFERQSRNIKFPLGRGLPGMVWKSATPMIADVANTNAFLRSQAALEAGISIGIGIPLNSDHNIDDIGYVVTFLSVHATPIARGFEIWNVTDTGDGLCFSSGIEDSVHRILADEPDRRLARGEGIAGKVLETGLPWLEPSAQGHAGSDPEDDLAQLAIPVYYLNELRSVVSFRY